METPFGIAWDRLGLDHLRAFLAEEPDEGLTWEAKGLGVRPEQVRQAVCAFANSELGGFLVLGVGRPRSPGPWSIGGWTPRGEPATWIESCLANGGVRPSPSIDVRSWPIDGGSERVAVVAIRPVAVPPALTASGEVLKRVSGASARVTDPAILRELITRGRAAEQRAAALVDGQSAHVWPIDHDSRPSAFAMALATPALPEDVSLRVFREAIAIRLVEVLRGRLKGETFGGPVASRLRTWVEQSAIGGSSASAFRGELEGYSIVATREGALLASRSDPDAYGEAVGMIGREPRLLVPMWETLVELALALDAPPGSPAILAIWLTGHDRTEVHIRRPTILAQPSEEDLASIAREAHRAAGEGAWEPDAGADGIGSWRSPTSPS